MHIQRTLRCVCVALTVALGAAATASEWPSWRGPSQTGSSPETDLISTWSVEGRNLLWRSDFIGRSTPIVLNGSVYVLGRIGEGVAQQERVACFDADNGEMLWEHRFNVFHTTVPFNRVGWASPVGDVETGNVYAHGVGGMFLCYDKDGHILWSHSLTEEFGRISGYGGRTHTPVVDEDLVIISFLNASWGSHTIPRHRYFAFDKRTGDVVWIAAPGGSPLDTTYSTPVVAMIDGQRLLIGGNADGAIYAFKVRTGETVWKFQLSKRGINSSVVVDGTRVYAAHSEENIDNTSMGRVVCIDGTGTGDVTETHEVWRLDNRPFGYTSPVLHDGRLYIVDNSANLYSLDARTGDVEWQHSLGTVGKGSPIWADGKLYVPEVNGRFHVLDPGADRIDTLDVDTLRTTAGSPAEIYGSPAGAYGRVYFATEEGVYCLGDPSREFTVEASEIEVLSDGVAQPAAQPTHLQIVPAEVLIAPSENVSFQARLFDDKGRMLPETDAEWSLDGLAGTIDRMGTLTSDGNLPQVGFVVASIGTLASTARVRVTPELPWAEDFESVAIEGDSTPAPEYWIGSARKFFVRRVAGANVLVKPPASRNLHRSNVYLGPPDMSGYTIQADLMGTKIGRNLPDMGLIANRYTLDLMGNHQRLQIRSWASDLRMAQHIDFLWEPNVWYSMKLRVDVVGENAVVMGKVWPTAEPEPKAWTISVEDPLPNRTGSPGLYGYSPSDIYYDNVKIEQTEVVR